MQVLQITLARAGSLKSVPGSSVSPHRKVHPGLSDLPSGTAVKSSEARGCARVEQARKSPAAEPLGIIEHRKKAVGKPEMAGYFGSVRPLSLLQKTADTDTQLSQQAEKITPLKTEEGISARLAS